MASTDPLTIPVVVDSVKSRKNFEMTRLTYFSIECEAATPGWPTSLTPGGVPFVMLGVSGVVHRPSPQDELFTTPEHFEELFDAVERGTELYVDTNDVWLPTSVFQSSPSRGEVYRVPLELFRAAHRYREGQVGDRELLSATRRWGSMVQRSPVETEALRGWNQKHISQARQCYGSPGYHRLTRTRP